MIEEESIMLIEGDGRDMVWRNTAGQIHRIGAPAVISDQGEWWIENGRQHRIDGPATIRSNGERYWYQNGRLHREDGPAVDYGNSTRSSWYLHGSWCCDAAEWARELLRERQEPSDEESVQRFLQPILQKQLVELI